MQPTSAPELGYAWARSADAGGGNVMIVRERSLSLAVDAQVVRQLTRVSKCTHRRRCSSLLRWSALPRVQKKTAVWVVPGSTADHLELAVGRSVGKERPLHGGLRIDRCEDPERGWALGEALWMVWTHGPVEAYPSRVVYGVTTLGLEAPASAKQLTPGCYFVTISGTGRTAFVVDSGGGVTELRFNTTASTTRFIAFP